MRLRELLETTSEKTVAKTWDEMTPKEKSSGVKGRTVWNEKTRKYRTVFDVPAKLDVEQPVAEGYDDEEHPIRDDGNEGIPGKQRYPGKLKTKGVAEAEGDAAGVPHISKGLLQHIVKQVGTEGAHALVKSLEWGDGAAKELLQLLIRDLEKNINMGESTVESKLASLEKKYNDIKGALGMAREKRKAKGQHVQSPREMQLSTKMSQAYDLLCKAKQA